MQTKLNQDPGNGTRRRESGSSLSNYTIPVPGKKKEVPLTKARALNQGSTMTKSDEVMVMDSGNCSFKFKFRLVGIERLNVLFKEMHEFVATENKETKPRNV